MNWALIEFDDGLLESPNEFCSSKLADHMRFIQKVSPAPSLCENEKQVIMISGQGDISDGLLRGTAACLGSQPSQKISMAYNVMLCDSVGVIDGDCGSLIVSQETYKVYGHVVGSNSLGEAYVIPMQSIFDQMKKRLEWRRFHCPSQGLFEHHAGIGYVDVEETREDILRALTRSIKLDIDGSVMMKLEEIVAKWGDEKKFAEFQDVPGVQRLLLLPATDSEAKSEVSIETPATHCRGTTEPTKMTSTGVAVLETLVPASGFPIGLKLALAIIPFVIVATEHQRNAYDQARMVLSRDFRDEEFIEFLNELQDKVALLAHTLTFMISKLTTLTEQQRRQLTTLDRE